MYYYCRGREDLEISVPDTNLKRMEADGSLRCDRVVDCSSRFWSVGLHNDLLSLIGDKYLAEVICSDCCGI